MVVSLLACAPLLLATPQHATPVQVIYSSIPSDPKAYLAGYPDAPINGVGPPAISPDGSHWFARVSIANQPFTTDEVVVLDGQVVLAEGDAPAWVPNGQAVDSFDFPVAVMDSGTVAFSGVIGEWGPPLRDYVAVRSAQGQFTLPGLRDSPLPGAPTSWTPRFLGNVRLTQLGPMFAARAIQGGPPANQSEVLILGPSIWLQVGVDIPAMQFSGAQQTWKTFFGLRPQSHIQWEQVHGPGPAERAQPLKTKSW